MDLLETLPLDVLVDNIWTPLTPIDDWKLLLWTNQQHLRLACRQHWHLADQCTCSVTLRVNIFSGDADSQPLDL